MSEENKLFERAVRTAAGFQDRTKKLIVEAIKLYINDPTVKALVVDGKASLAAVIADSGRPYPDEFITHVRDLGVRTTEHVDIPKDLSHREQALKLAYGMCVMAGMMVSQNNLPVAVIAFRLAREYLAKIPNTPHHIRPIYIVTDTGIYAIDYNDIIAENHSVH